ncbi:hypothetical protein SAMN05443432_103241 [Roseovarius litoreus]|uniref:Uncharacterized protein n=1 Tax=Roseovarius litoreus TaxID=1155722 RepID=A0A1M7E7Y9_9RHOB|nr:hypothetical protein [Roseovarius litoreus]SHL87857.1 hypothetical protein SAMN05443432_103241 [Roseovarius litoreus]
MTRATPQGMRRARRAWAAALRKHIKRGHVYIPEIQHDYWCTIYTNERVCTCNPDRVLKDIEGRTLARVEGAGPYNPLELVGAMK